MIEERFREVADLIRKHPTLYDQTHAGVTDPRECGTACCVLGWAAALNKDYNWSQMFADVQDSGAQYLGIEYVKSESIFEAEWPLEWWPRAGLNKRRLDIYSVDIPTAEDAAVILEAMADSGDVWG